MAVPENPAQLRHAREAANLTQEQLAERLGVSRVQVSRVETGDRSTTPETIRHWYEACGFRLEAIAFGSASLTARAAIAFESVTDDVLETFLAVMRAWPHMTEREQRTLLGQLRSYAQEHRAASDVGSTQD